MGVARRVLALISLLGLVGCEQELLYSRDGSLFRFACGEETAIPLPHRAAIPRWSPDGRSISYRTDVVGRDDLYVTDRFGRSPVNQTARGTAAIWTDDSEYHWAPDGTYVAYMAVTPRGSIMMRVPITADGSGVPERLTPLNHEVASLSMSRDGRKISYASDGRATPDNFDLYTAWPDGTNRTRVEEFPDEDVTGSWLGPGDKIAFRLQPDLPELDAPPTARTGLFLRQTGGAIHAYSSPINYAQVRWSADGDYIIFSGGGHIYKALTNPPYTETCLTCGSTLAFHTAPAWLADDRAIIFTGRDTPAGARRFYRMDPDGSDIALLGGEGPRAFPRPGIGRFCIG